MDGYRFDELARSLAASGSRRGLLRTMLGGAAGGLLVAAGLAEESEAAARCKKDGDCRGCRQCKRRSGETWGRCVEGCGGGKVCCDGACQVPGPETCCTKAEHCGDRWGCMVCQIETGRCEPRGDGQECRGCKRCKNGACTEADPELLCGETCCATDATCVGLVDKECCPDKQACNGRFCCRDGGACTKEDDCCPAGRQACGATGDPKAPFRECCAADEECVGGECCKVGKACGRVCCEENQICRSRRDSDCCPGCIKGANGQPTCCPKNSFCIDDGFGGDEKRCCHVDPTLPRDKRNKPCGENGDGTFRQCCVGGLETCVDGECKADCAGGRLTAEGVCCPHEVCNGVCCAEGEICGVDGVCENPYVCPRVACSNRGLRCCPPNDHTNTAYCCKMEWVCANTPIGCAGSQ